MPQRYWLFYRKANVYRFFFWIASQATNDEIR